jgi:hypothetical protein
MFKRLLFILCCLVSLSHAQDSLDFNIPFDAKKVEVGFINSEFVNTSTVRPVDYLFLTWDSIKSASGYRLYLGVPKFNLVEMDFGLTEINWFSEDQKLLMNFISPQDLGNINYYVLHAARFDWVARVVAYGTDGEAIAVSQIRYIRQKRD